MSRDDISDRLQIYQNCKTLAEVTVTGCADNSLNGTWKIQPTEESNNMSNQCGSSAKRRVVTIEFWDDDAGLSVEDALVFEIPGVRTEDDNETTIQQALVDYDVAGAIIEHNEKRAKIVNESILVTTGREVMLRPIQLKNLRRVVVG